MKAAIIISFILLISGIHSFGQEEEIFQVFERIPTPCTVNYRRALEAFEIGDFENVISLLSGCTTKTLSDQEKIDVHILLSQTYYSRRENAEAEDEARKVYRVNPEHKLDPNGKIGIQNIFQRVKPKVQYSLSLNLGANFAFPNTVSATNYEGDPRFKTSTKNRPLPAIVANLQWKFYTDFEIIPTIGISYTQSRFRRISKSSSSVFEEISTSAEETIQLIQPEIGGLHIFKQQYKGLKPFVELGVFYAYLLKSNLQIESTYVERVPVKLSAPGLDISENRRDSFGAFISLGALKRTHRGNYIMKLRFDKGLSKMVNQDLVLQNPEWYFFSGYFDNDFVLNNLSFQIGYERYIFKFK